MMDDQQLAQNLNNSQAKNIVAVLDLRYKRVQELAKAGSLEVNDYEGDVLKRQAACSELILHHAMTVPEIAAALVQSPTNLYNPARALAQVGVIKQLTIRRDRKMLYCANGQMEFLGKLLGIEATEENITQIRHVAKKHEQAALEGRKTRARTPLEKSLKDPVLADILKDYESFQADGPTKGVTITMNTGDTSTTKVLVPFKKASTGESTIIPLQAVPTGLAQFADQAQKAVQQVADAIAYAYIKDLMLFGVPRDRNMAGEFIYTPKPGFLPESQMSNPVGPVDMFKGNRMQPNRADLVDFLKRRQAFFAEMAAFLDRLLSLPCWDQSGLDELDPALSTSADPAILNKVNPAFLPMSYLMGTTPIYLNSKLFMDMAERFQAEHLQYLASKPVEPAEEPAESTEQAAPVLDTDQVI